MMKVNEKTFPSEKSFDSCKADGSLKEKLGWTELETEKVLDAHIFNVWFSKRRSFEGKEGNFVQIRSRDWVNIIPVFTGTDGVERFVMERQFRHGSCKITQEFPAGLVEEGEKPEDAALRELEEECGIRAHGIKLIGRVNTNPAFMNNTAYFFLATDLEYLGTRKFDENEDIETFSVPVEEVLENAGKTENDNGVTLISCFYYLREKSIASGPVLK